MYRRENKGRRCWLRDVFECRTNHLAARMIWREHPFCEGVRMVVWYAVNQPFFQIIRFAK